MRGPLRERLDGMANPILVREMYQSVHNRTFLAALWLLVVASLLTYVIVYVNATPGDEPGEIMFTVFAVVAYFIALLVLPYQTFASIHDERRTRTIELIQITGMDPRKQVRGRLLATLVKLGLMFAILGPFAVAAFLFKGIGVGVILLHLYLILILSTLACAVGILFGTIASGRWLMPVLVAAPVFAASLILPGILPSYVMRMFLPSGGLGNPAQVASVTATITVMVLLGVWLLCEASANVFTFEANKSSARTKFVTLLVIAAAFLSIAARARWTRTGSTVRESDILPVETLLSVLVAVGSLFWMTEKTSVARRTQEKLERRGVLYRVLYYPFTDGVEPASVFLFLPCFLMAVGAINLTTWTGSGWDDSPLLPPAMLFTYVLLLSSLARIGLRLLPGKFRTPLGAKWAMTVIIALNAVACLLTPWRPHGIRTFFLKPLIILLPFAYILESFFEHTGARPEPYEVLYRLAIPGLAAFAFHLALVIPHFRRYMRGQFE